MNSFAFVLFLFLIIATILSADVIEDKAKNEPPKFPILYNVTEPQIAVKLGEPALMYCFSRGDPLPILKWFYSEHDPFQTEHVFTIPKNNTRILFRENKQELFFRHTVIEDAGYYTCNGTNTYGSTAYIYKLTVHPH